MRVMKYLITGVGLTLMAWGCALGVTVKTNGFLNRQSDQPSIITGSRIYVKANLQAKNSLLDEEISGKIKRLLQNYNYEVSSMADAQFSLEYDYEIDQGRIVTETIPEYHPGDVLYRSGRFKVNGQEGTYSDYETTPAYITHVPVDTMIYTRKLILTLRDNKNPGAKPVWIGESYSQGPKEDLREMIDYLLVGAFRSFGKDTQRASVIVVPFNDHDVLMLRGP